MTKLQQELLRLNAIWKRRDVSLAVDFEAALASVAALNDPRSIGPLLDLFEDDPPSDELLFSVVHAIEAFADQVYLRGLLAGTGALQRRSPRWARILYMRVLNAPPTRSELAAAIPDAPDATRAAVADVLDGIDERRPEFADKTAEVRRALGVRLA